MKTVVIKFKKIRIFRHADPFDTTYGCITGGSIMNTAIDLAHSLDGYVKSFKEKEPNEYFHCKLVVRLPEENELKFVHQFTHELSAYIDNIKW